MSSQCPFSRLSTELLLLISNLLLFEDRKAFASTTPLLREVFAPTLFSAFHFSDQEEDGDAIAQVATKLGKYVRRLHFQCHREPDGNLEHGFDEEGSQQNGCSKSTIDILKGITFPESRMMTFEVTSDDFNSNVNDYRWRAVMSSAWTALSKNASLTHLEIVNLPPVDTTTWRTEGWKKFMSQLQRLSIKLWGDEDPTYTGSVADYEYFLSKLNEPFFDHAHGLQHLEIRAGRKSLYGGNSGDHAELALTSSMMPRLKVLELEYCVIDTNLLEFVKGHLDGLEVLNLTECNSYATDGDVSEVVLWKDLFDTITMGSLMRLIITNTHIPLTNDESCCYEVYEDYVPPGQGFPNDARTILTRVDDEPQDIRDIRTAIKQNERKLFSYTSYDDVYATADYYDHDENVRHFKNGDDQRSYDKAMAMIATVVAKTQSGPAASLTCEPWRMKRSDLA